jgi:hypothetical protein
MCLSSRCGAVVIVLLATWILRVVIHTSAKEADPIDITKLSFTVAGGVGAAVALVVAYRRQRDVEQGRFVERFGAAAAQLGDHDVAMRIAGVYAMAGAADESTGLRRQQCIDVPCGYLRLPYSPELGSNHRTKLVLTEPCTGDDGSSLGQQEEHLEYRQNDKEVRATIVRVIADHLRDHEYSWSACDFDLRTAHLEDVDLPRW